MLENIDINTVYKIHTFTQWKRQLNQLVRGGAVSVRIDEILKIPYTNFSDPVLIITFDGGGRKRQFKSDHNYSHQNVNV